MTQTNPTRIQNGTFQAHNRTWPMYERQAFVLEVRADLVDPETAKALKESLAAMLPPEATIEVVPVTVSEMSSEDQAEKNALDEAAINRAA